MSKRRLIVIGGGVLVVATAVFLARPGAIEVTTAVIGRDTLSVTVPAEGQTRARERFTVTAPISGRLTRIDVHEGDVVESGQLLGLLYPAPQDPYVIATARAEVAAAETRHLAAEALRRGAELEAQQAQIEAERRRPLADMGALTRERMEQAELSARVAAARVGSAEAGVATAASQLDAARARLSGVESGDGTAIPIDVTAPAAGRVMTVADPSSRVVPAGTPLLSIAQSEGIEIVMDVLSEDAVRIGDGDPVLITRWGGDGTLPAQVRTVTRIGHTKVSTLGIEEQRVNVVVDLAHPPAALGTGYRVSGEIVVWEGSEVLTVPTSAAFRTDEGWQLFVVEAGRAQLRSVTLGHRNERFAEVLSGLDEGDRVVVFPPEALEDGSPVRVGGDARE
jgi:HlyD family secretion protein